MAEQVLPDSNVYALSSNFIERPSADQYQVALDAANKNVVSPNESAFKPIGGFAGAAIAQPVLVQKTVEVSPSFDVMKPVILIGALFLAYHFLKGHL